MFQFSATIFEIDVIKGSCAFHKLKINKIGHDSTTDYKSRKKSQSP